MSSSRYVNHLHKKFFWFIDDLFLFASFYFFLNSFQLTHHSLPFPPLKPLFPTLHTTLQLLEGDCELLLARITSKQTRLDVMHGRLHRTKTEEHDKTTSMTVILEERRAIEEKLTEELWKQNKMISIRTQRATEMEQAWRELEETTASTMARDRVHLSSEFEDRKARADYELQAIEDEYKLFHESIPVAREGYILAMRRAKKLENDMLLMAESLSMLREHKLHSAVEREYLTLEAESSRLRNLISHLQAEKLLLQEDETRAVAQRNVMKRAMMNQRELDSIDDRVNHYWSSGSSPQVDKKLDEKLSEKMSHESGDSKEEKEKEKKEEKYVGGLQLVTGPPPAPPTTSNPFNSPPLKDRERTLQKLLDHVITDVSTSKDSNTLALVDSPQVRPPPPPPPPSHGSNSNRRGTMNLLYSGVGDSMLTKTEEAAENNDSRSTSTSKGSSSTLSPTRQTAPLANTANRPPPPPPSTSNKQLKLTPQATSTRNNRRVSANSKEYSCEWIGDETVPPPSARLESSARLLLGQRKKTTNRRTTVDLLFGK